VAAAGKVGSLQRRATQRAANEHPKENKRAQRALGRSTEEKVKGHSGAIYRVPLMMLYTKYESSVVSDKKIF